MMMLGYVPLKKASVSVTRQQTTRKSMGCGRQGFGHDSWVSRDWPNQEGQPTQYIVVMWNSRITMQSGRVSGSFSTSDKCLNLLRMGYTLAIDLSAATRLA